MEQHPDTCQDERFGCSQRGIETAENQQKKTFFHPEAEEEAAACSKKRSAFTTLMRLLLIYIDESGFSEDMPKILGYASAGLRCFGKHDSTSKRRTDGVGALTGEGLLTASLFDGSINADVF